MASVKIIQRTDKKKNGECPLYLRIYHNGKKVYKSLGIYLAPKYWNESKQIVRASHDYDDELNLALEDIQGRAKVAIANVHPLSAKNIKNYLEGVTDQSFYDYADSILKSYRHDYRHSLTYTLKIMKEYKKELMFSDITPSFLKAFERWLMRTGRSQNTATEYLQRIRTVLNRALRDEVIQPKHNPFVTGRVRLKREPTNPTPLTLEQFKKIRDVDLPKELDLHRDMFLFATYNDGMRLGDVLRLKESSVKGSLLKYTMSKTGKPKALTMVPAARQIVEKYKSGGLYLFPFLPARYKGEKVKEVMPTYRSRVWRRIKKIGKLAGLEQHLHFHMSRNTSAYVAYKSGASIVAIQDMLGHSDIQQTRAYLGKMDGDDFTEMRNDMWK